MSTATPQQGKSAPSPKAKEISERVIDSERAVVLIRLPWMLRSPSAAESDQPAAAVSAGGAPAPGRSPLEVAAQAPERAASEPVTAPEAAPTATASPSGSACESLLQTADRPPLRPRFDPEQFMRSLRVPKQSWQVAGAMALLLLTIYALRGISVEDQQPSANSLTTANLVPEGDSTADASSAPRLQDGAESADSTPRPAAATGVRGAPDPRPQAASTAQDRGSAQPPEQPADEPNTATQTKPDAAAPRLEPMGREAGIDALAAGPTENAAKPPSHDATAAGEPAAAPPALAGADDSQDSSESNSAPPMSEPAGPLGETANAIAAPSPPSPNYPATDPATYQYPTSYQDLFQPAAADAHMAAGRARQDRGSVYPWQPNTARLQPQIEPPPLR